MIAPPGWHKREKARQRIVRDHAETMLRTLREIAASGFGGNAALAQKIVAMIDRDLAPHEEPDNADYVVTPHRGSAQTETDTGREGFGDPDHGCGP